MLMDRMGTAGVACRLRLAAWRSVRTRLSERVIEVVKTKGAACRMGKSVRTKSSAIVFVASEVIMLMSCTKAPPPQGLDDAALAARRANESVHGSVGARTKEGEEPKSHPRAAKDRSNSDELPYRMTSWMGVPYASAR